MSEAAGHGRVESAAGYFDSDERQDRQMNTSTNAFNAAWARMCRFGIWMREISSSWNRYLTSRYAGWPAGGGGRPHPCNRRGPWYYLSGTILSTTAQRITWQNCWPLLYSIASPFGTTILCNQLCVAWAVHRSAVSM